MAHVPTQANARLPHQNYLVGALTQRDWKHRIYVFNWAIENLNPRQLARYHRMVQYYRPAYHTRVQQVVDQMGFAVREYKAGRKLWRGPANQTQPTATLATKERVGNWARGTMSLSGCGCGCGGAGNCGMGGASDIFTDPNTWSTTPQPIPGSAPSSNKSTFDYTNPNHWVQVINGGIGVVGKVACMIDPNLAYCKGQTATPPNFDVLCAQPKAASTPACQQYLLMKAQGKLATAQQQYNLQQPQKKDNTPLYLAAAVTAGVLLMGASQPSRRR